MADSPPYTGSDRERGEAEAGPAGGPPAGTPRWVKVFGIIALVLVVLVGVMLLTGGATHGPGRHTGSGDRDGQAEPSGVSQPGRGGNHRERPGGHAP